MKKGFILIVLSVTMFFASGQRFFYLEPNNTAGSILRDGLIKSSQFVTKTPLASDYIIKTDIGFKTEPNTLTLQIILEDSITFKTIYQTNEEYSFGHDKQKFKNTFEDCITNLH